jgi:Ala-tRNA(Pro) deacylase
MQAGYNFADVLQMQFGAEVRLSNRIIVYGCMRSRLVGGLMPVKKIKDFLDSHGIKYMTISHSAAYTAQEIAAVASVPGKELAKTVIVRIDGRYAMAVLPASCKVDFELFREQLGASKVELAGEHEFSGMFPECEIGAMPPFGSLYGVEIYMCERLRDDREIAFNAGTHTELIKMQLEDFERLEKPRVIQICRR